VRKKIRRRLRITRNKLSRITGLLNVAHRETHRQWAKARAARENAEKASKQGREADARKANARADFHQARARRWERRTDWLAGKKSHLEDAEKAWVAKKEQWIKDHPHKQEGPGTSRFGSVQVANWMIPWLEKSKAAGWSGYVVSGFRTPEYSRSLCRGMCDADSCPGQCAGVNSNHACPPTATCKPYEGAIDVTDYFNFQSIQYRIGSPLRNHLPYDRVHFSASGY
jgi:hypothetical protein